MFWYVLYILVVLIFKILLILFGKREKWVLKSSYEFYLVIRRWEILKLKFELGLCDFKIFVVKYFIVIREVNSF